MPTKKKRLTKKSAYLDKFVSDHLYGFAAFLTTRKKAIRVGASANTAPVADLLQEYIKANKLPSVSAKYPDTFVMPNKGK